MGQLSKMLEELAVLEILARLPNDIALTSAEASVFLRLSISTLERLRSSGSGPKYIQGGRVGTKATNQKCMYRKQALIDWQMANELSDSMQAAMRKGQTFVSLSDLLIPVPVWRDPQGALGGLVDKTPIDTCMERIGVWDIEWIPAHEAACEIWNNLTEHRSFSSQIQKVMNRELHRIQQAEEGTELSGEMTNVHSSTTTIPSSGTIGKAL